MDELWRLPPERGMWSLSRRVSPLYTREAFNMAPIDAHVKDL